MIGYILNACWLLLFWSVGLLGFAYFGPPQWTGWISERPWVRDELFVRLDAFFTRSSASDSQVIARLETLEGELNFRPSSELVFLRARIGQRFSDGTVVSSGTRSRAVLTLSDDSRLTLAPNSTLLLEIPEGQKDSGVVNLRVVQGQVAAQKDKKSDLRVKLVTPRGQVRELAEERLAVFAPRQGIGGENVVTRERSVEAEPKLLPIQEYIGKVQDLPVAIQQQSTDSFVAAPEVNDLPVLQAPSIPAVAQPTSTIPVPVEKRELRFEPLDVTHLETFELRPVAESRAIEIRPLESESFVLKELPRLAALEPTQIPEVPIRPLVSELVELKPPAVVQTEAPPVVAPIEVTAEEKKEAEFVAPVTPPPPRTPAALVPALPVPDMKPVLPAQLASPSNEEADEGGAEEVEQEVVKRPRKTQFEKPPEGNDLSRSLYLERTGNKDGARRLRARAITREGYSSNFEIVRSVLEDQIDGALQSSNCSEAQAVLQNAKNAFPKDKSVDRWVSQMRNRMSKQCKSN